MLRQASVGVIGCLFLMSAVSLEAEQNGKSKEGQESFCPEGSTNQELGSCASEEYRKENLELNRVYREILEKYKEDPVFIKKLRASQRAWLKFRDAQFDMKFPQVLDSRGQYNYGRLFPMCANLYKAELTHERVDELRLWLNGRDEGDVCAGSLPYVNNQ